ncbi:MAG TPA: 50S ribosomal protein L11 methyltransferase [Verrucomicrobiae bacterium]|nr:50S ribosomal protein L11 methyltransferase [Verrucomicrobiae bacterium]
MNTRPKKKSQGKRQPPLWTVAIVTQPEADDAVSAILEDITGEMPSSYTDVETQQTSVTAYLSGTPDRTQLRRDLAAGLRRISECGLRIEPGRIAIRLLRREDWAESWKRHFRAIEIGKALLLKPSWIRIRPKAGQAVVVLDPGLSFGTGQHPTTSFCLQQLVRAIRGHHKPMALLDIGTGSGVLAIAGAKLGYARVHAFDFDPESVRIARENARVNGVARRIQVFQADLTRLPRRAPETFDVVCANLISTLLVAEADRIVSRLGANGTLIVAGILDAEFESVATAFASRGFKLSTSRKEKEWRSGMFQRTRQDA